MDENQNQAPRRVSFGFILSFLLVIGFIGLMVYLFFFSNSAVTLREDQFTYYVYNNQVTEITSITPKEGTLLSISGRYVKNTAKPNSLSSFKVVVLWETFTEEADHTYAVRDNSTGKYVGYVDENGVPYKDAEGNLTPFVTNVSLKTLLSQKGLSAEYKDPYVTNFWQEWGPTIIMLVGSAIIMIFLFSRLSRSVGGSNMKALEFNKSRARRVNASHVKFDDVAGADEEKLEMQELVAYLKEPKKFSKFGAKLPKGVLLVGPPGCGKTLLAKAVAGEAGVPFYSISGSDFVEMFVGVGAGRVRDMFRVAKENAPCLIFIDEIDAVGRQRGAGLGGGNDEREQTLNQLLVEMDGFSDNAGIIVIAATNRDDVLDPALLRAGRFDRKITVSLPDRKGREEIFKVHARNKTIDPEVNFEHLSRRTVGFSGADIENILNEAAILAVRKGKTSVGMDEIDEAIDRRVAGPAKTSRSLNEHEKKMIAYHESGHAIIGLKHPHSDKVQKITIIPRGNTGGHVRMTPEEDRFLLTKSELEARIIGYLGGRTSEEIFFEDVTTGASNDIEVATRIARMMVTELGMSPLGPIQYENNTGSVFLGRDYTNTQRNFSTETALAIDNEVRKIIEDAHQKAREIILANKEDVILIANTLLEHEQITAEEIDYLLEHRHLKRDEAKLAAEAAETTSEEGDK